jgi:potassium/chloride transporter 4/5/6
VNEGMPEAQAKNELGTFLGVFTPTILTILGAIMYLRFGWVVGNAGIIATLVIVGLANAITFVTALSISSLATNMRVGTGGAYYIISRSLGLEIGGAVGLPLFLAQAVSLTLYCYGLAEALTLVWPALPTPFVAGALVLFVAAIAARSMTLALKAQIPILVLVALSLASLFAGADWSPPDALMVGEYTDATFWGLFAVFFPAVTGILAGVSLSGDLKDPDKSLPVGTLLAVLVGTAIYLAIPYALGGSASAESLRTNKLVWLEVAAVKWLVLPGLFGAILSSAIGSILAAPRTLKALADDKLVSSWFGELDEESGEPKRALVLAAAVAFGAVFLGGLDAVAVTVSMFFLTTYAMVNVVCGLEGLIGDPSFRPRLRVHWSIPLVGAAACMWVMMLIHPAAATLALAIEVGLWFYLSRRALTSTWGDMRGGLLMSLAVWALVRKREQKEHRRSWRPHMLVFTSDVSRNLALVELIWALNARRGVITVCSLVEGDLDNQVPQTLRAMESEAFLMQRGITAFCEVDVVPDIESGMVTVAQANGIAGLASNTVVLGWPDDDKFSLGAMRVMRRLDRLGKSLIIVRQRPMPVGRRRTIIVWWTGKKNNGDLMLLLAHLLRQSPNWRGSRLLLKSIVSSEEQVEIQGAALAKMCAEIRIEAAAVVHIQNPEQSIAEQMAYRSRGAAMVMLGLALPEPGDEEVLLARIRTLTDNLPTVVLVRNSGPFRGELI